MDPNELYASLAAYQFEPMGSLCCGCWSGYAVSLRRGTAKIYYADVAIRVQKTGPVRKAVKATLKAAGKKLASLVAIQSNVATFSISFANTENPAARFAECMFDITAALTQAGAAPADTCAVTGASNPDSLCLVQTGNLLTFQPVNGAAVREQNTQTQSKVEDNENNGNYITGILGAIIGAALGIALNVLIIVLTERIFALAFAAVPMGAMFGYKLLKGKTNKIAMVVVILLSVIAVPVICILAYTMFASKELSIPFGETLSLVMELLPENAEIRSEAFSNVPMMVLFMALGLWIAWRYMSSSLNSNMAKASAAQLASLRPNPNFTNHTGY